MAVVVGLTFTPVKATRLHSVSSLELGPDGVGENRRFFVIDARDRMVNSKIIGELQTVIADYSASDRRLRLELPDGRVVEDEVRLGDELDTRFFSETRKARVVEGPWSEAFSEVAGRALRLVEPCDGALGVDRGPDGAVSLISRASLARLASAGGVESPIDVRRFRMLVEIDGVGAHEEDGWVGGRPVRIGGAVVAFGGHVGRCLITSRDPDTGVVDLPTLDILGDYRGAGAVDTTEPLPFGVWGRVVEPGTVRVGDEVSLVEV
jgi:MOSC domain-containing protein